MVYLPKNWSIKQKLVAFMLIAFMGGISQFAIAKAYACQCSYQDGGSSYAVSYVSEGGGCCTGNASNGAGLVERTGRGSAVSGYVDGGFAQSLCCGNPN